MLFGTWLGLFYRRRESTFNIFISQPHTVSIMFLSVEYMGATACDGKANSISMPHSSTNMKVWGGTLWPWNTKIKWGLRDIAWANGWSAGSRYSHNLTGLRFQESPADDKMIFFSAFCTGINGTKYNCVLQWMLVHHNPKRAAIAPLTKGRSWTDFCMQLTLGIYPGPVWYKEATQNGFGPWGSPFHGNEEWHLLQQPWCNINRQLSYNMTMRTLFEQTN